MSHSASPGSWHTIGAVALVCCWLAVLVCLILLAGYIWAPLPPQYSPDNPPEGQGEGMALVFLFGPGVLLLVGVTVAIVAVMIRLRRP